MSRYESESERCRDSDRRAGLQRFVEVFSTLRNQFVPPNPSRHSAIVFHLHRLRAIAEWRSMTLPPLRSDSRRFPHGSPSLHHAQARR